jgi:flagellar biosynthetic protein FlhB
MLQNQLGGRAWLTLDAADVSPQFGAIGWGLATTLLPILVLVSVAAVLSQLAQSGFLLFPQRAVVDPQRINPAGGLGRLLSLDGTLRAFLGVVKLAAVAALTVWCALTNHQSVATAAAGDLNTLGGTLGNALLGTSLKIGGLMLAFGVADYAWNWWRHERSLRMTTQEIRDEQRALNGDPQVAAKRRATRYQLSESGQAQAIARVET